MASSIICVIMFGIVSIRLGIFEKKAAKLGVFGVRRVLGLVKPLGFSQ